MKNTERPVVNTENFTEKMTLNTNTYQSSSTVHIDLLTPEAFLFATIDGMAEADTPWKSNIVLLEPDDDEQGLLMLPGTAITYTVEIPTCSLDERSTEKGVILHLSAKIFDSLAEAGVSDGMTLIVDVIQDGNSLKTYEQIVVTGDGNVSEAVLDLTEWQRRTVQIRIRCYDGGNDDATGDWCVVRVLELTGKQPV